MERVTRAQVLSTYKERDSWWTVFLVDPVAGRLVWLVSAWRWVTPNVLTTTAFLCGLAAAAAFALGTWPWLVAGALLFHLSFTLDCMDGKVARLRGGGSLFGGWLDYIFDRLRVLICALALFGGQYAVSGNPVFLYLGTGVVFCDMFRYLNALYLKETRQGMRAKLAAASGTTVDRLRLQDEAQLVLGDHAGERETDDGATVVDVQQSFKQRFGWFNRMRDFLVRHRVRSHLFSGVEFQMAVFIVGPLTTWVFGFTVAAMVLLLLAEAAVTYKLYLSARDVDRQLAARS
ncbi:CDP-alcohol phosphatidyltransferase-like enzyme [Stackebrandtia albiflava]|uniref:CDP-alcohol phosphatidyltransferase-like enzyme n=1 Tax=Stackebrandtia albiflava TaxID=406432 RepID=A0A562V373_9ACTN|nr:CDP-alcohol phosphatidyltransferase family protein [Stackebrandtia albiflava]TWJ12321.1 CDP-alcohol phosphatidyltransferase-like enzyme [Stackebrandtia albiflava]